MFDLEIRLFYTMFFYMLLFMVTSITIIDSHLVTFCLLNYTSYSGSNCMCNGSCVLHFNFYRKQSDGCQGARNNSAPCRQNCVDPSWSCPTCQGQRNAVQLNHCMNFDITIQENITIEMDIYRCSSFTIPLHTPLESLCTDVFHIDEVSIVKSLYPGSYRVWYRFNTTEILTTTTNTATRTPTAARGSPTDTPTTVSGRTEQSSTADNKDGSFPIGILIGALIAGIIVIICILCIVLRWKKRKERKTETTKNDEPENTENDNALSNNLKTEVTSSEMPLILRDNTFIASQPPVLLAPLGLGSSGLPSVLRDKTSIPSKPPLHLESLSKTKPDSSKYSGEENNAKKKKQDSPELDDEEKKTRKHKKKKKKKRKKERENSSETGTRMTQNASYSENNDITPVSL